MEGMLLFLLVVGTSVAMALLMALLYICPIRTY